MHSSSAAHCMSYLVSSDETPRQHRLTVRVASLLSACLWMTAIAPAQANAAPANETITVNTLEDVTDFGGARQVNDLPGPDGRVSFREACIAANNTAGPQTIAFEIPQSEWWLYNDRAMLRLEDGAFTLNDNATTVDFTTQTQFTGDTNPDGWEVGIYGLQPNAWGIAAIFVNGDGCTIKGLDRVMQRGAGVEIRGNNNRVISCSISGSLYAGVTVRGNVGDPATGNVVGGTGAGEGNILSGGNTGVRIDGPTDGTVVIGNTLVGSPFAGVQVRGAYCCPEYTPINTRIGGPTPEERNWIADNGKYGQEGFPLGDQVQIEWAQDTVVEGNFIGTTENGDARFPGAHGTAGISIRESVNTLVRGNLISGIKKAGVNHHSGSVFGQAIGIRGPNEGVQIVGNQIGSDASGLNPVPNRSGIGFGWFQGYASGGQIGGNDPQDGNLIAYNDLSGITIDSGVVGVSMLRNSIHSNGLIGIDLLPPTGESGPTPNDAGDGHDGANGLQNYPNIASAARQGQSVHIVGELHSEPFENYTLEFFASRECDPSGFGEGEMFIGSTNVTTDSSGHTLFDVLLAAQVPEGWFVTSTATLDADGSTSEFSECVVVTSDQLIAWAEQVDIILGSVSEGTLEDTQYSDDVYFGINRGAAFGVNAPSVWLEFDSILSTDNPSTLSIQVESYASTNAITQKIYGFNFATGGWELLDSRGIGFNQDTVADINIAGDVSRLVEMGTGKVRLKVTHTDGPSSLSIAWKIGLDQIIWEYSQ